MEHITAPRPDPHREDFFSYRKIRDMRNNYFEQRGHGKQPEKFHIRSDHFLHLFNEDFKLKGDKAVSRRTLQFYSSPQARLFPLPTYKNRHTAYYLFPDHYELLGAVWTMRSKLFMPIDMIRTILKLAKPHLHNMIIDWDESPEALIDAVMMDKRVDIEPEEFHLYSASKDLLDDALILSQRRDFSESDAKKAMLKELDKKYAEIKAWIASGRAGEFLNALNEGRQEFTDMHERLAYLAAHKVDGLDDSETEEED
ncbi:MAG: hypothetical protein KGO96_08525 [Elusimicrobia bacterium]|nr:hypothetical protein [Elusimicrobiota bacterium]MDE2425934.1 hypothetical protein [Elusimicrobiota bacterium]